jgi:hypothetical protein
MASAAQIFQFGNQIELKKYMSPRAVLDDLIPFEDQWSQYNTNKSWIPREGLCIVNERGETGPGPAMNSLVEWNATHGTDLTEADFVKPTPVFHALYEQHFKSTLGEIVPYIFRSHFLRLRPGGFFPPHRDSFEADQTTFRLIVPLQNCNPPWSRFMLEDRTLHWTTGHVYAVNTTLEHTLFNMNIKKDSVWLVINAVINDHTVDYVRRNLSVV